ncbi:uncharacterized protein LOC127265363 [Andrographis paniculata]|uniref:uncharacterized protein LOC127265363 n=1 Tax=Andrographis paniculata TaxID=175694 RepID=UPI0021E7401E|nr:uncharacterized protein LOC127265363 [Andrographis paniculata]XP_051151091.1 uncharacterized protein LOC127265363 [Andrographis paniculata]
MFDPRIRVSHSYNHGGDHSLGSTNKGRSLGQSDGSSTNWLGGGGGGDHRQEDVQLRPNFNPPDSESLECDDGGAGVYSPPLWRNSPSPPRSPSQPLLGHHHHLQRSLSPRSRIQTIVKGQRELMEMVKNMPESSYELSLKDLVEHDHSLENQAPPLQEERFGNSQRAEEKVKKGGGGSQKSGDKNVRRSGSFESKGLFLKMGFPFSSLQKRSNYGGTGKVSPRPAVIGERDWWKKKFTGSSDSDSSRTSNTSGSTNSSSSSSSSSGGSYGNSGRGSGRKKNGLWSSCWPSFQSRRAKYA